MYSLVQGISYLLYAYNLHHNFVLSPTFEKFNPRVIFHTDHIQSTCETDALLSQISDHTYTNSYYIEFG